MNPTQPFLCTHGIQKRLGIWAGSLPAESRQGGTVIFQSGLSRHLNSFTI